MLQPDALGYTRQEANEILARRGAAAAGAAARGQLMTPLELDSALEVTA
jgi:hypothetical protein